MNLSIVMAYRDMGCPYRRAAFEYVSGFWRYQWPTEAVEHVVVGDVEPFTRARALNEAVRRSSGDVIFECGPDSIVSPLSVRLASSLAFDRDGLVVCHDRYFHLTLEASERLMSHGFRVDWQAYDFHDAEEWGEFSSDITCFSRRTWELAGGYEERFGLWAGDDGAFALACDKLVAPTRRVPGTWLHLWHPRLPQSYPDHPEYVEQQAIYDKYRDAADADEMRAVIAGRQGEES
jgi:hypothetical protein